jgi:hypothetical protein
MVVPDKLSRRADQLEEALGLFNSLSKEAGGVLEQLSSRLTSLTELTAPIHGRAFALTSAQANVIKTKREVERLLESLDTSRKLQPQVEKGAQRDLDTFLQNLQELERSLAYLQQHSQLASARQAIAHAQSIFERAMQECSNDFVTALQQGSAAALPSASTISKLALEKLSATGDRARLAVDLLPKQAMPKIVRLAATVLQARPAAAVEMYVAVRDRSVEQVLRNLATEPAGAVGVASAEQLERSVQSWCLQLRALLVLAISEQQLAEAVWPAPHAATAATAVVTRHLRQLLQLGKVRLGPGAQRRQPPPPTRPLLQQQPLRPAPPGPGRRAPRVPAAAAAAQRPAPAALLLLARRTYPRPSARQTRCLPSWTCTSTCSPSCPPWAPCWAARRAPRRSTPSWRSCRASWPGWAAGAGARRGALPAPLLMLMHPITEQRWAADVAGQPIPCP